MRRAPGTLAPGRQPLAVPRLVAWIALLAGAIAIATGSRGSLPAPPVTGGATGMSAWLTERDPASAAMAVVRVVVLAMAWYLLVTTLAAAAVRAVHATAAVRALDAVTLPSVRRLVTGAVGLSRRWPVRFRRRASRRRRRGSGPRAPRLSCGGCPRGRARR